MRQPEPDEHIVSGAGHALVALAALMSDRPSDVLLNALLRSIEDDIQRGDAIGAVIAWLETLRPHYSAQAAADRAS